MKNSQAIEFGQGDDKRLSELLVTYEISGPKASSLRQLVQEGYSLFMSDEPPTPGHSNLNVAIGLPEGKTCAALALLDLGFKTQSFLTVEARTKTSPYNEAPQRM